MGPLTSFLCDTDILVDFLRAYKPAVAHLKTHANHIVISAMTVAELYAGVRDDDESQELAELLLLFPVLPVDGNIARLGGLYNRDYFSSHGVGLADALIAATAQLNGAVLQTLNVKHFPMFPGIKAPYSRSV